MNDQDPPDSPFWSHSPAYSPTEGINDVTYTTLSNDHSDKLIDDDNGGIDDYEPPIVMSAPSGGGLAEVYSELMLPENTEVIDLDVEPDASEHNLEDPGVDDEEEEEQTHAPTDSHHQQEVIQEEIITGEAHATLKAFLDDDDEDGGSDFEGYDGEPQETVDVDGIMTNIFGDSDDNDEFEGFAETEIAPPEGILNPDGGSSKLVSKNRVNSDNVVDKESDSSSSSGEDDDRQADGFVNDFDRLMEKRREDQRRRKRKHDSSYITDIDDTIADIVRRMRDVAEEDRELVRLRQPAVKKLKMLPIVTDLLIKSHLRPAMIEAGILKSIMDWLSPLPDHSLPSLPVREELVNALLDFPAIDTETLKESGIGKAIMFLRRHPHENTSMKLNCSKLIDKWSRIIFQQNTDYKSLSREERIKRDQEHLEKRRKTSSEVQSRRDLARDLDSEERPLRPGDPGFMSRARVPQPSNRDYLIRPEWKVKTPVGSAQHRDDESESQTKAKRFDRHFRSLKQKTTGRKKGTDVFSIEGRKMVL